MHLSENRLCDESRATGPHAGGITHMRQIPALADLHQVRPGCHGATDLSPVTMAAALHLGLAIPNFGVQEYMRHTTDAHAAFPPSWRFAHGIPHSADAPGHGLATDPAPPDTFTTSP